MEQEDQEKVKVILVSMPGDYVEKLEYNRDLSGLCRSAVVRMAIDKLPDPPDGYIPERRRPTGGLPRGFKRGEGGRRKKRPRIL